MPEQTGSLARHAAAAACLTLICATFVSAQQPDQPTVTPAPSAPEFLSRADFHVTGSRIASGDIRFSWDTHFGGSFDIIDYVVGRIGVYGDFEAVLGDEFRIFDPNQGNYSLEGFATGRVAPHTEIVGMFHHVSRHLSDRSKRFPIAWNYLGAGVLHQLQVGSATIDFDLQGAKVTQRSFVDYSWIGELHVQATRPVNAQVAGYGRGALEWYGVAGEESGRGRQWGGLIEGGVRLKGGAGVMELFAGIERRVDADPLDLMPQNWFLAGFRLLSR